MTIAKLLQIRDEQNISSLLGMSKEGIHLKKVAAYIRDLLTGQVLTFIGGVLTSILVRAIFGQLVPINDVILDFLVIFFVLLSIAVLLNAKQVIRDLIKPQWHVNILRSKRITHGDTSLYNPLIDLFRTAKYSIRALGLYRPPELELSVGRDSYYNGLKDLLEKKHLNGENFKYERIIQVQSPHGDELSKDQVDSTTYKHCEFLLSVKKEKSPVTIRLRQIPSVLSSLSIVVVDDKIVLFALPYISKSADIITKALSLSTIVARAGQIAQINRSMAHR